MRKQRSCLSVHPLHPITHFDFPPFTFMLLLYATYRPSWFSSIIFQAGNGTFNRAKLLNVGVREALRDEEWDCLFLHDVDLLPENDHNLYVCDPRGPRHVAVAMNKFGYR